MFLLRSYGRLKGKNLNRSLLEELPNFLYNIDCLQKIEQRKSSVMLDVGCGYGESLLNYAVLHPDTICIGCEVYLNGLLNIVRELKEQQLQNVLLCNNDVRSFLSDLANISSNNNLKIDHVYILFPDPWTKTRHYKRRLINNNFILMLLSLLKQNGTIICATDHSNYAKHMKNVFTHNSIASISILETDSEKISQMFCETRYQKKAGDTKIHHFLIRKKIV